MNPVHLWLVAISPSSLTQALTNSNRESFKPNDGTTRYAAPEVLRSRETKEKKDTYLEDPFKVDVYSFGITAYEVLTRYIPFEWLLWREMIEKIKNHDLDLAKDFFKRFKDATKRYPELFISFMQRCWAYDPRQRPTFQEIIEKIEEAKEDLHCKLGDEPAKYPRSETKRSKHGVRLPSRARNWFAPQKRNNQVSDTPILPPNPQLLMSTLTAHNQSVEIYIYNCSFIQIYSCIEVFVSQWSCCGLCLESGFQMMHGWIF